MRPLSFFASFLLLGLAAPGAHAAPDADAPTVNLLTITDCEGNPLVDQYSTSTGTPNVSLRVVDVVSSSPTLNGMGLRFQRTEHRGGTAAGASLINFMHFNGSVVSSDTYGNNGVNSGTVACGSGNGFTGLAGDDCQNWTAGGQFVRVNKSGTLASTTVQMTLQAWINPASFAPGPIFEFNDSVKPGVFFWHSFNANGDLYANLIDTNDVSHVVASSGGFVKTGTWQLVTMTYDSSVAKIYLNDIMIASRPMPGLPPLSAGKDLFIGRRTSAGGNTYSGKIDEVRVYNTVVGPDTVEGDTYGGLFLFKTTTTASTPFTEIPLVGANYTPASPAYGSPGPVTATVNALPLSPGGGNQLVFSFQDLIGNTRRTAFGVTVVAAAPDVPLSLQANPTATDTINWTWARGARLCLSAGGGVGQFKAYRPSDKALLAGPQNAASFSQGGLGANSLNGLGVSAIDAFGESALTSPTSAYTRAAAPTALVIANVSTGSAVLSWTSANPAYTRFEVVLSSDNFVTVFSTRVPFENNLTAAATGLLGLAPQTTYNVRVRAMNGRSSDQVTLGTLFTTVLTGAFSTLPAAPGTLSGTSAGPNAVTWTWTAVPTAISYTLESATGTNLAVTAALTHTVTNLAPNNGYGARLLATNPGGPGAFGPIVSAFTDPVAPSGLLVSNIGTATAKVDWNGNGNPGNTSYLLQITTDPSFGTVLAAQSVVGNTSLLGNLLPGTTYQTRVRASGFNGTQTGFSGAVTFVTDRFSAVSSSAAPSTPYGFPSDSVAVWHFDETGGTRAADATSFLNHGALSGVILASTPVFVTAQTGLGNALRFPGLTESVMAVPHSASLSGTGDLSVEAWVNPAAFSQVDTAGVVVKGAGGDETYMLDALSTGRWRFAVRDGAGTLFSVTSTQSLRVGSWTFLAGVYKAGGAPSLSLYIDGTLSAAAAAPAARRVTVGSLSIGNRRSGPTNFDRAFRGDIDEVHVATSAVSAAQVGADYAAAQPAVLTPPSPNDLVRLIIPPNAFGGTAVVLISSSPGTTPIRINPQILSDGLAVPPTGQTLVPNSVFEIVASVGGLPFAGPLGSTVTVGLPYPDSDSNGLVDGTFPPIPAARLKMYTLNPAVTTWEALPTSVDTVNKRVLGQTGHFSIFALFGPTGIKPNTDQVRLYPRPWRPGSGTNFDSVTFAGRTGLAMDNLPTSGAVSIFTLSGELVRELPFGAVNSGTLIWDGANAAGRSVASGVYFAYVRSDDGSTAVIKFAVER